MPRRISGLRAARSMVTPEDATVVSRVLDFNLGAQQGIELAVVSGGMAIDSVVESTDTQELMADQSLHLEAGQIETIGNQTGEDEDLIDTEVIWQQFLSMLIQEEAATRGGSHAAISVSPAGPVVLPSGVYSARNITHAAKSETNLFVSCHVHILYYYILFSLGELGLLLARRA